MCLQMAFMLVAMGPWKENKFHGDRSRDRTDNQITRAYKFFERKIRPTQVPDLEKLKQIIVSQLVLVSIVLDRDDNPHLVFESLNAKGRALSQADLIRN